MNILIRNHKKNLKTIQKLRYLIAYVQVYWFNKNVYISYQNSVKVKYISQHNKSRKTLKTQPKANCPDVKIFYWLGFPPDKFGSNSNLEREIVPASVY